MKHVASLVREAFETDRFEVTKHFWHELGADGFLFVDVGCALNAVLQVIELGQDEAGHPKYELTGPAIDERKLSVVCSIKETGVVLFITVYEGD